MCKSDCWTLEWHNPLVVRVCANLWKIIGMLQNGNAGVWNNTYIYINYNTHMYIYIAYITACMDFFCKCFRAFLEENCNWAANLQFFAITHIANDVVRYIIWILLLVSASCRLALHCACVQAIVRWVECMIKFVCIYIFIYAITLVNYFTN